MNNIHLLATDIDGTLMQADGSIAAANIEAIRRCLKKGVFVYLVTGRPYSFARMIADRIHPDVQVIAANGGIYECNGTCIEQPIDPSAIAFLVTQAENCGVSLFLKGKHDYYANVPYDPRFLYDDLNPFFRKDLQVRSFPDLSAQQLIEQAHDILKILTFHEDGAVMQKYRRLIENADLVTVTDYRPISFDITAKGVDKGSTLQTICQTLHLSKDQVVACGDANNDQAMFACAGWRVAMSNASSAIQEMCDAVVDNQDGAGVARAIQQCGI